MNALKKKYKKTYGVFGLNEYSTIIPCGNSHMRVDFTDGSMSVRGVEPAKFVTSNEAVQAAIESSDKYLKGKIKLLSKIELAQSVEIESKAPESPAGEAGSEAQESPAGEAGRDLHVYDNVVNSQQAKEVLRNTPYNVPLSELSTKDAIKAKAESLNVSFPNWK